MAPIAAWVFDLDGVLVDSEPIHMRSWQEVMRRHGKNLGEEWFKIGVGMTDRKFWERIAPEFEMNPGDESVIVGKRTIFDEMIEADGLPVCPGVQALLDCLKGRYPIGIATSSGREYLDFVLERNGWGEFIAVALSRHDVSKTKPDPEIYLRSAELLGAEPRNCVAIEDSPPGLQSALDAGLRTIGVTTNFTRDELSGAGLVVESLEELDAIGKFTRVELL
jgi:HAD superfamily hydrolase (TIGR01509 family)